MGVRVLAEAPVRGAVRPEKRRQGVAFVVADAVVELGRFDCGPELLGVDVYQDGLEQVQREHGVFQRLIDA